jgi:NhaP-type Na+/H+ or K+/H+ antiporter
MILYFFVESLFEKYKPPIGHTTGIIISLGVLFSFIIFVIYEKNKNEKATGDLINYIQFKTNIFFDVILPLIVFPSGYNMRRKKFFQNIGTVMKFGFLATVLCFAIYSGLFFAASELGLLTRLHPESGKVEKLDIGAYEILSICSLLCSSDVIAAISMVDFGKSPKLFSIIYGEGVFNDIVSIILFGVV